jgi:hypothetical protein
MNPISRPRALAAAAAAVAGALDVSIPAAATAPGDNGRIVFASDRGFPAGDPVDNDIFAVDRDGSAMVNLTPDTAHQGANDVEPAVSPDGEWVYFRSDRVTPTAGAFEIWRMRATDGASKQQLTHAPASTETQPAVSPDGATVAFTSNRPVGGVGFSRIWAMDADGGDERVLVDTFASAVGTFNIGHAEWSPDGSALVFSADNPPYGVWRVAAAGYAPGSGQDPPVQLTTQQDRAPTYSPDGGTIAFQRAGDIWLVDADGDDERNLTASGIGVVDGDPVFSPDGTALAFRRQQSGSSEIVIRDLSSGTEAELIDDGPPGFGGPNDAWPAWAPLAVATDSTPPVVTVPDDLEVEATGPSGATVTFGASAVDETDGPVPVECSPPSGAVFPLGVAEVTCEATDAAGNVGVGAFTVTVVAPLDCAVVEASPDVLWPADRSLRPVTLAAPGGALTVAVTAVTQDEPAGVGRFAPDAVLTPDPGRVLIRSERDGLGDGRVYVVSFEGRDAGRTCSGSVSVAVPHDLRPGGAAVDSGQAFDSLAAGRS